MELFSWDQIFNWYNALVAFLLVFGIVVKTASNKWKRVAEKMQEFIKSVADGVDPNGPGGKNITKAEASTIAKKAIQTFSLATWTFFDLPFIKLMKKILRFKK
jgi:hypothetical protein